MSEWIDVLPPDLMKSAYHAGDELAWSRPSAVPVVQLLKASGYMVLGVEIWLPTRPGPTIPTPFIYGWDLGSGQPPGSLPRKAEEFIPNFSWADEDNITARRCDS